MLIYYLCAMFSKFVYINVVILLFVVLLCSSCEEQVNHNGKTPLIGIDKDFLYKEDIERFYVSNMPIADSVDFVNNYIHDWLENTLLLRVANRNIPEGKDVERLVEDYRKSLILNMYQDKLIEQQLKREIPEAEVQSFYERNKELFVLDEPMIRGVYLKVTKTAPKIASVRKWINGATSQDIENLEKYSLTNGIIYEYFIDNWCNLEQLAAKMPITVENLLLRLKKDNVIEFSDENAIYFVNAADLLLKGEQKTLDMAYGEIESLLLNSLKVNFMNEVKKDLVEQAVASGDIKIYDKRYSIVSDTLELQNK